MLIKYVKSKLLVGLYNCSDRSSLFKNIQPKSCKRLQLSIYISYNDYINVIGKYGVIHNYRPSQTEKNRFSNVTESAVSEVPLIDHERKHPEVFIAAHLSAFSEYYIQSEACYSVTE